MQFIFDGEDELIKIMEERGTLIRKLKYDEANKKFYDKI
jgi:hypothetical protein